MIFDRLTVIKRIDDYITPSGKRHTRWLCKCDCGNETSVIGYSLTHKKTKSCGCLSREVAKNTIYNIVKKYNTYDLSGDYGVGYTAKGEEFYFDLEDYYKIKDHCWRIDDSGYLQVKIKDEKIYMHRLIMECPDNLVVDHIYGKESRNDNRKSNLRICTQHENTMNCAMPKNNTSGVKGVTWDDYYKKWNAYITINYKKINLGYFVLFDDAVKARKEAENKYFGEYNYKNSN